jgi:callose synthase
MPFDLVFFQLQRIKTVGELTSYNIVPLEAPSLSNAIGVFPEVS